MTTTRLLLPFTGNINPPALNYAVQFAQLRQATLVPLALLQVRPRKAVRLEMIQQAQDFLESVRSKARRQGVPVEQARVYTSDVVRSIEAVAGEMNCEAVMLFLSETQAIFLDLAEAGALMDHASCNIHLVLFPTRRAKKYFLHIPLLRRFRPEATEPGRPTSGALREALRQGQTQQLQACFPDEPVNSAD